MVEMDGDGVAVGGCGDGREVVVYVSWGDELDDGVRGEVRYVGGWTKGAKRGYGVRGGAKKG